MRVTVGETRRRDDAEASPHPKVKAGEEEPNPQVPDDSLLALLAKYIGIGWLVAICVAGGTMAGLWLDGRFSTKPVFTVVGLILGLAAAVLGLAQVLRSETTQSK